MSLKNQVNQNLAAYLRWHILNEKVLWKNLAQRLTRKASPQRALLAESFKSSETHNFKELFTQTGKALTVEKGFWSGINQSGANSIAGYIPYKKGSTKIGLYHYWSVNYGLRKQVIGHIVLLKGSKFASSLRFTLPSYGYAEIDLAKYFGDLDGDNVYLDLYHPRIPSNHGGHDGHIRFWGIYGDHASIVHSMTVPKLQFRIGEVRSSRASFPQATREEKEFFSWGKETGPIAADVQHLEGKTPFGFYAIKSNSIWHSSEYTGKTAPEATRKQAVALPDFNGIDVVLSFVEAIKGKGTVRFSLFDKAHSLLAATAIEIDAETQLRASDIFKDQDLPGRILVVDLTLHPAPIHHCYIHLVYSVNGKTADCVHSHQYSCQKGSKKSQQQCLKFMPVPLNRGFNSILGIWTSEVESTAKVRFLMENGQEYVSNFTVPPVGIMYVDVEKELGKLTSTMSGNVLVQLESSSANFDASLFTKKQGSDTLAVDHLTGG